MLHRCPNCFKEHDTGADPCPHCGFAAGTPARELYHLYPGMTLRERYIVGQVVSAGDSWITYKAWNSKLNTLISIKEYYPDDLVYRTPGAKEVRLRALNGQRRFENGKAHFLTEARNMTRFGDNLNTIKVFDFFEENGTAYIAMEYLDGVHLSEFLQKDDMDVDDAVRIASAVCAALADLHDARVIHGDISPENIFLCADGGVKLTGFGKAQEMSSGPWRDIHALGVLLHDMLDREIPEKLRIAIAKAMAEEASQSFASAAEFAQALPQKPKEERKIQKQPQRLNKKLIAIIAAFVMAAIIAVSLFFPARKAWLYNHLPKSRIEVWYSLPEDDVLARQKQQAYEAIKGEFENAYPKVTVVLVSKPEFSYPLELQKQAARNHLPALFEASGIGGAEITEKTTAVGGAIARLHMDVSRKEDPLQCMFLMDEAYLESFAARKRLPLGFRAPVFYVNSSLLQNAALKDGPVSDAASMAEMLAENTGMFTYIKTARETKAAFVYLYGDAVNSAAIPPETNGDALFIEGKAAAYFSDSSEYSTFKSMQGLKLYPAGLGNSPDKKIPAAFSDYWSIGQCDRKQLRCAEAFLCYLLSDFAQTALFLPRSDAFPLNEAAFKQQQRVMGGAWQNFFGTTNQYLGFYAFSPNSEE